MSRATQHQADAAAVPDRAGGDLYNTTIEVTNDLFDVEAMLNALGSRVLEMESDGVIDCGSGNELRRLVRMASKNLHSATERLFNYNPHSSATRCAEGGAA